MKIKNYIALNESTTWRENVLYNVKALGQKSKNNRYYPDETIAEALHLYDDLPIYINHDENHIGERRYEDLAGFFRKPRFEDGIVGEAHLNPMHPLYERIKWDYENGSKLGFSHQIGKVQVDADGKTIRHIGEVFSLDLVTRPATTITLKEEEDVEDKEEYSDDHETRIKTLEDGHHDHEGRLKELENIKKENEEFKSRVDKYLSEVVGKGKGKPKQILPVSEMPEVYSTDDDLEKFAKSLLKGK